MSYLDYRIKQNNEMLKDILFKPIAQRGRVIKNMHKAEHLIKIQKELNKG